MGPDELDNLLASIREEDGSNSALALYEGTREDDLVDENIDERILRILGLDEVFDIDYGTYLTLLREKLAEARMVDKKLSTEESMLLTDEFKRVRGNVGRFKIKRKKITSENIGVTGPIRVSTEKFYLTSKAVIPTPATSATDSPKDVKDIEEAIDRILKSLTDQNKLTKKKAEEERKSDEKRRRIKRESELEKPIKKAAALVKKIVAPFQSILDRIMRFIQFTLLGYFVDKVLKWFSDPENERKIKVLGRFLKDWWPALLTAYGLFATPFGLFVRSTLKLLRGFIPQMVRFMAAHPYVFGAAAAGIGAYAAIQMNDQKRKDFKQTDPSIVLPEETAKTGKTPGASQLQQEQILQRGLGGAFKSGGIVPKIRAFSGGAQIKKEIDVRDIQPESGLINEDTGLKVKGAGPDTQMIVAKPGEIVMSNGAVDKYGADFFLDLNRKGGGTNIPRMVNNIQLAQGGGIIRNTIQKFQGGGMVGGSGGGTTISGGGMVGGSGGGTTISGGNILNSLGRFLPGTGRVMAPRGRQWKSEGTTVDKFLGITIPGSKRKTGYSNQDIQRFNKLHPKRSISEYNAKRSDSLSGTYGDYVSPAVQTVPKAPKTPTKNIVGESFRNFGKNVQTIEGAVQRQEKMMREMGVKPSGYVNLRGQPINLGPQSRSTVPGTPVISSKTQMIVLPPTTSVAQKPTTPTISGTQIPEFSIVANTAYRTMISDNLGIADLVG